MDTNIIIATGKSRSARSWKSQKMTWSALANKLAEPARGGAMHDILNVRHLKISTFRRRKTGVQPFGQLPSSQTLRDKWLPSFSQNVDCFF